MLHTESPLKIPVTGRAFKEALTMHIAFVKNEIRQLHARIEQEPVSYPAVDVENSETAVDIGSNTMLARTAPHRLPSLLNRERIALQNSLPRLEHTAKMAAWLIEQIGDDNTYTLGAAELNDLNIFFSIRVAL